MLSNISEVAAFELTLPQRRRRSETKQLEHYHQISLRVLYPHVAGRSENAPLWSIARLTDQDCLWLDGIRAGNALANLETYTHLPRY